MRRPPKKYPTSILAGEHGTIDKQTPFRVALGYPAPYGVGVSSLGFQQVYRVLNSVPALSCGRFFLPPKGPVQTPLVTVEARHPVGGMGALLFSVACERELIGLVQLLEAADVAPLAKTRGPADPPVIIGGPLTYVDPALVAPLADVVAIAEADTSLLPLGRVLTEPLDTKDALLGAIAHRCPELWLPGRQDAPPPMARCKGALPPAFAATWSPDAELGDLFLVEVSRGCPRRCGFCTMSRKSGFAPRYRLFDKAQILAAIPDDARAVGLVGAAVSEHPEIENIVAALVAGGRRVSLSSLRADRLTRHLARLLKQGGLRTMTVGADGMSQVVRDRIEKQIDEQDIIHAATAAADAGFSRLRVYAMVGLPGETDQDVDAFANLLLSLPTGLSVTVSAQAFVPKPATPLGDAPMASISLINHRLNRLKQTLKGRVQVQPTSPRWSWVDWKLAHAGRRAASIAMDAHRDGATFAAWKQAIERHS